MQQFGSIFFLDIILYATADGDDLEIELLGEWRKVPRYGVPDIVYMSHVLPRSPRVFALYKRFS